METYAPDLEIDRPLKDNTRLTLGDLRIRVFHTPGYTMGSLCFYLPEEEILFSGQTVLRGEFGRIRGPYSMLLMVRSLKRLNSVLPPETDIYPGRGPLTKMRHEGWMDCLRSL